MGIEPTSEAWDWYGLLKGDALGIQLRVSAKWFHNLIHGTNEDSRSAAPLQQMSQSRALPAPQGLSKE